jgi:hypothetical protein
MDNRGMNSTLQVRALSGESQGSASFVERMGNYASQALLDSYFVDPRKARPATAVSSEKPEISPKVDEREGAVIR